MRQRDALTVAAVAALVAAAVLWARRAGAAPAGSPGLSVSYPPSFDTGDGAGDPWAVGALPPLDYDAPPEWELLPIPDVEFYTPMTQDPGVRLRAFLFMLRAAETGYTDERAYFTFYGGSQFRDLTDHPVATGEKRGIRLPDAFCRNAGLSPGCVSTAAGAYQITLPTWREFREAGAWGPRLENFDGTSQDEAARRILLRIGALPLIEAGEFARALSLAAPRWASLPGSTAGQGGKSFDEVLALYEEGQSWWGA